MAQQGKLTTAADAERFIHGGKAIFTLVSERTGARFTFKVTTKDGYQEGDKVKFVSLLAGPDNTADYVYVGILSRSVNGDSLKLTAKSKFNDDSDPVKAFRFLLQSLMRCQIPAQLSIFHEGRCCRCCRLLTVPESVTNGIGPECATKMAA